MQVNSGLGETDLTNLSESSSIFLTNEKKTACLEVVDSPANSTYNVFSHIYRQCQWWYCCQHVLWNGRRMYLSDI